MPKTKTLPWDPSEHLNSEAEIATYLEAALEDGDPSLVAAALGDIARARGMTQLARETGLGRESLYKSPEVLVPAHRNQFLHSSLYSISCRDRDSTFLTNWPSAHAGGSD